MGELVRAFNFRVTLQKSIESTDDNDAPDSIGNGGFQECSGLQIELEVQELQEGGRNDGVIRRIGRAKYEPITLKRGMFSPSPGEQAYTELWGWLQQLASRDHVVRYDGTVDVLDAQGDQVVASWSFIRGLPAKITGPQLNARTGEIAIEELQIAHEGLTLDLRTG